MLHFVPDFLISQFQIKRNRYYDYFEENIHD